jgi:hypothetical protein
MPVEERWTFETLKRYLETRIDSLKENVALALANSDKAVNKAETAVDRRLESMNELRGALNDQAAKFITRAEYIVQHQALIEKVDVLAARVNEMADTSKGRSSGLSMVGAVVGAVIASVAAIGTMVIEVITRFRH